MQLILNYLYRKLKQGKQIAGKEMITQTAAITKEYVKFDSKVRHF